MCSLEKDAGAVQSETTSDTGTARQWTHFVGG